MNSKAKGNIAVGKAISYFLLDNISVSIPIGDNEKYDLIIDKDSKLLKVQCKYTSHLKGKSFIVCLTTFGGYRDKVYHLEYKKGDFDLLFTYCQDGSMYLIPYKQISGIKRLSITSSKYSKYKL